MSSDIKVIWYQNKISWREDQLWGLLPHFRSPNRSFPQCLCDGQFLTTCMLYKTPSCFGPCMELSYHNFWQTGKLHKYFWRWLLEVCLSLFSHQHLSGLKVSLREPSVNSTCCSSYSFSVFTAATCSRLMDILLEASALVALLTNSVFLVLNNLW